MTTITWKDNWMAADTQTTIGNYTTTTKKLYSIEGLGVAGFAGGGSTMLKIAEWWRNGCQGDAPELPKDSDESCQGILATAEGVYYLADGIVPMLLDAEYFAIGSGSDFAITAMSMGKDAKEAVEEAIKHDVWTGGRVDAIYCPHYFEKEEQPKTRKKGKKK